MWELVPAPNMHKCNWSVEGDRNASYDRRGTDDSERASGSDVSRRVTRVKRHYMMPTNKITHTIGTRMKKSNDTVY